jgi:hypothetical protein
MLSIISEQDYGGISKSFRTCLERELKMIIQLSAIVCSCIAIL